MHLTPEERAIGKRNFNEVVGVTRRDFLKAAATVPALGAFYFGYRALQGNPVRAGLIGTGDEGGILLTESTPDYLRFIAYSDIRPSNQKRIMEGEGNPFRIGFKNKYGKGEAEKIKFYLDYRDLLKDPDLEMVVIATPLSTHKEIALNAMQAGKDVLCEKLMAHSVAECKEMARAARDTARLLAVGHQRHYSILYTQANDLVQSGVLGEVKHIRALWHRNSDSWNRSVPKEDEQVDFGKYGYDSLRQLVAWRLFNKTSGGLMAELGSHQLDACGIFFGHARPIAVSGVGTDDFYNDDREIDDHIYVNIEYPGGRVVSYSSIQSNAMEGYGEHVMGTKGNLVVYKEQEALLFSQDASKSTAITVKETEAGGVAMRTDASPDYSDAAAMAQTSRGGIPSRGYREEMEHFAYCLRNRDPENQPRCGPQVALEDAVIALTANAAMKAQKRIEFQESWFDMDSEEVPDPRLPDGSIDVSKFA